jgi:hypothetical protein
MQKCTTAILLLVGMALAMPCMAQNAPGGAPAGGPSGFAKLKVDSFFAEIDTNKDGKLSSEEWKAAGLKDYVFSMVDGKNKKQGFLTKEELATEGWPLEMDANKDGVLTIAKMKAYDNTRSAANSGGAAPGGATAAPQK